eukprot:6460303-Amphidinium_carterae.1
MQQVRMSIDQFFHVSQEEALTGKEDDQKRRVTEDSSVCGAFVPVSGLLILLRTYLWMTYLKVVMTCMEQSWKHSSNASRLASTSL